MSPASGFTFFSSFGARLADLDGNGTLDALALNQGSGSLVTAFGRQKTRTALAISPEPSTNGAMITYTATVTPTKPDTTTMTGTVRFYDGTGLLGSAPIVNRVATLPLAGNRPWYRTISAEYAGDGRYLGSLSAPRTHLTYVPTVGVPAPSPTLALAPLGNPGNAVRVRVSLTGRSDARLTVHDVRGRLLASRSMTMSGVFEFGKLAPGVYLVNLEQDGRRVSARAVVL